MRKIINAFRYPFKLIRNARTIRRKVFYVAITIVVIFGPFIALLLMNAESILATFRGSATSPIGYWRLDEGNATTAGDSSGNSNSGTITGALWKNQEMCVSNNCLQFDGSDDNIQRADDSDFDYGAGASFSVSVWIKHPEQTSGQDIIVSKFNEAGYKLIMESDGDVTCGIDYDSTWTPTDSVTSTAATYDDNQWHHVVCVKNANTSLTLYIDGISVGTPDTSLTNSTLANTDPLYVGIDADGTSNAWLGFVDEFKFYNYALSTSQMKADLNMGSSVLGAREQDVLSNGLQGYWGMDETSAWTNNCSTESVSDSSGNSNTGESCPNADGVSSLSSGRFGAAPNFDGSNDYVAVDDADNLDVTGSITVSAWVNADTFGTGTDEDRIFMKGAGSHDTNLYTIEVDDSKARFILTSSGVPDANQCDGSSTQRCVKGSTTLSTGQWYHIVGTYDPSTLALRIYVNGVLDGTVTLSSAYTGSANGNAAIIGGRTNASDMWDGKIDEVRVYNRTFTTQEVSQLFNFSPGPVGYWNFEEGTGTSTADKSGNANTGTLTNGASWTTGKAGKAINFDGVDDVVDAGSAAIFDDMLSMTLESWVYIRGCKTKTTPFRVWMMSLPRKGSAAT